MVDECRGSSRVSRPARAGEAMSKYQRVICPLCGGNAMTAGEHLECRSHGTLFVKSEEEIRAMLKAGELSKPNLDASREPVKP